MSLNLDNTLGALYISIVLASTLHGVSCIQAFYYFMHQNDKWPLKALVSAVMIFDTTHQVLICHGVYTYMVTHFGDYQFLGNILGSLVIEVLFNGLTALLVQSFLAMRVWRLSNRNVWLMAPVVMLIVGEFVCIVAYTAMSIRLHTFVELAHLRPLSVAVNAFAAAGDVVIAAALCMLLHRSRTGFQRSETMINTLIIFTVNTGCLTSLCALASLISITVAGKTFIYITFFFCIGRLYSNSLLATLNAREMIRGPNSVNTTDDKFSLPLSEMPKTATIGSRGQNISIKIDTSKETDDDSEKEQNTKSNHVEETVNEKGEPMIACTPFLSSAADTNCCCHHRR